MEPKVTDTKVHEHKGSLSKNARDDLMIDTTDRRGARAALTGLRHRGYDVRLERGETGRASVYRAVATLAASA